MLNADRINMTENIHFTIEGSYQYDAYHKGICFQRSWHRLKYQKALKLLDVKKGDNVLDAACGSGVLTDLIAGHEASKVTGVDFNEAAIRFCKSTYTKTNLDFFTLDLTQKHFDESTFDKIVMLETIEHLEPDVADVILKNLHYYLKPGGKLVLSTPNKRSAWPIIESTLDLFRLTPKMKNEQHVKLYYSKSLSDVLKAAGFKIAKVEASHFIAPWLSFLGLKTSEKIHAFEERINFLPGSLLFVVAEK